LITWWPLTALLQVLHQHERAELTERSVLGRGGCLQRLLERRRGAKSDRVVLLHGEHC
jgi:hypothetical protein